MLKEDNLRTVFDREYEASKYSKIFELVVDATDHGESGFLKKKEDIWSIYKHHKTKGIKCSVDSILLECIIASCDLALAFVFE